MGNNIVSTKACKHKAGRERGQKKELQPEGQKLKTLQDGGTVMVQSLCDCRTRLLNICAILRALHILYNAEIKIVVLKLCNIVRPQHGNGMLGI